MLNDIESKVDYLNFRIVADPVATMIKQSGTNPISIGVSGNWGAGKSSMVQMIADSLTTGENGSNYRVVDFNAWLYQGYEDARLALLQQVADKLGDLTKEKQTGFEKFKEFLARVNWFKLTIASLPVLAKAAIGALALGPAGGMAGGITALLGKLGKTKSIELDQVPGAVESLTKQIPNLKEYWKEAADKSMPKEIEALRKSFAETLKELDVRLVVVVDDLDRCLPDTALSTLEAMRLLLMVERTVFIIAADETMIRQAVRIRYGTESINADRETSYFDKLVQVPVYVPRPGPNEVKCYIMMLLAEMAVQQGKLSQTECSAAANYLREAIKKSWAGKLTRTVLAQAFDKCNDNTISELIDIADQISGIMTTSPSIGGNPRLIKRFLNNLMIRKLVAESQEMGLSFDALIKLHLFERCAPAGAFDELAGMVVNSANGKLVEFGKWEDVCAKGDTPEDIPAKWKGDFFVQWIALSPSLANVDLRPFIYLSQEDKKRIVPSNDYSPEGRTALAVLLETRKFNPALLDIIKRVESSELESIFDILKSRSKADQWSVESLSRLLYIPIAVPAFRDVFLRFFDAMPASKRASSIIPHLSNQDWAVSLLEKWANDSNTPKTTVNAIRALKKTKN